MRAGVALTAIIACVAVVSPACASTTSGLAIDTYLNKIVLSFVGVVAGGCALIAIVVAGRRLLIGGDMTSFMVKCVELVVLVGLTATAPAAFKALTADGAVITAHPPVFGWSNLRSW